jgi:hypothetical protein
MLNAGQDAAPGKEIANDTLLSAASTKDERFAG